LQAKLETKALKAKRPGFTDERYNETSYYVENGLYFEFICYIEIIIDKIFGINFKLNHSIYN
jgi:hypothetical protein